MSEPGEPAEAADPGPCRLSGNAPAAGYAGRPAPATRGGLGRLACIGVTGLLMAGPAAAQQIDATLGLRIVAPLGADRVVVRNGGRDFVCTLGVTEEQAQLSACRPVTYADEPSAPPPAPELVTPPDGDEGEDRTAADGAAEDAGTPPERGADGPASDGLAGDGDGTDADAADGQEETGSAARPAVPPEQVLAAMTDRAWRELMRQIIAGLGCEVGVDGGERLLIERAAEALGVGPSELPELQDELFIRADRALVALSAQGELDLRDGVLVLRGCP